MANRIQFRRDSAQRWASINPVLMEGEIGFETDTNHFKLGNGTDAWNNLEYGLGIENITSELGNSENLAASQKLVTEGLEKKANKNEFPQTTVYLKDIPCIRHLMESTTEFSFTRNSYKNSRICFLDIHDLVGQTITISSIYTDSDTSIDKVTFYDKSLNLLSYIKDSATIYTTIPENAYYISINSANENCHFSIDRISERLLVDGLYNGVTYNSSFFGLAYPNHIEFICDCEHLTKVAKVAYTNSEDNTEQFLSYRNGDYTLLKSWSQDAYNSQNIHQLTKVVDTDGTVISYDLDEPIFGAVKIRRQSGGWEDGYTCVDEYGNSTVLIGRHNAETFYAAFVKKLVPNNTSEVDSYLYYKDAEVAKNPQDITRANILTVEYLRYTQPFAIVDGVATPQTFQYYSDDDSSSNRKVFYIVNLPIEADSEYYLGSRDCGFLGKGGTYSDGFYIVFQDEQRKPIGYVNNDTAVWQTFNTKFAGWSFKTPEKCRYISALICSGNTEYSLTTYKNYSFVCKKVNLKTAISETINAQSTTSLTAESFNRSKKSVAKRIWTLGDSISATGYGGGFGAKRTWGSVGGWVKYFCEQIAPDFWANNAQGGYTVTESSNVTFEGDIITSGLSGSYIKELEDLITLYNKGTIEQPDYLMIVGCTNDFGKGRANPDGWSGRSVVLQSDLNNVTLNPDGLDYDSFMEETFISKDNILIPISEVPMFKLAGAIRYLVQRVGTLFPNCKFIIVTSLQSPASWVTQKQCHDEMKWIANRLAIPVIDVSGQANTPMLWDIGTQEAHTSATNPRRFINDGFHPYGQYDSSGSSFITAGAMYQGLFIAERFRQLVLHDTDMPKNVIDYTTGEDGRGYPHGD